MNRRNFLVLPAGMTILWAAGASASAANEELKRKEAEARREKRVYPYNEFTLHRVNLDKFGLPYAGEEDPTIHVLTSVTKEMCCDYSGFSFVVIKDGLPEKLLTAKEVIMIPRRNS